MEKVPQRAYRLVILALSWAGVFASFAFAQLPTATILGVVKDSTGAVVPGASLTARSTETGQTRTVASAGDGSYRFSALPVGGYEVRVEQSGFQTAIRSGLTLTVAQEAVVNFTLEVGAVTQTIAVTAEAPLVNTTSGSLGALVDERRVTELPLNGRNFMELTMLQPGVTRAISGQLGASYSSGGAPPRSNNYLLDGAPMVGVYGGSPDSGARNTLGLEGIREWRVITNSLPAEYGMTMGSQMVIVTKSGTNAFHGSLFEYLRNSALDARNFFDYQTVADQRRLPAFTRNNFGGSLGGPIVRDRTFFHVAYEKFTERLGRTMILNVIPREAKVDGGLVPQVSPLIKPFLAFFPDPNLPGNRYTYPYSQRTDESYGQARVDQNFSDQDTLFARYTINDGNYWVPINYPGFERNQPSRNQFVTLSESHIFSPTLLNTFRVSFSRMILSRDVTGLGLLGPEFWFMPGQFEGLRGLGQIIVGGITTWAPETFAPSRYKKNTWVWSDDLFYTRGRHALKFGALINRLHLYMQNPYFSRGELRFADLRGFLLAQPSSYRAAVQTIFPDRDYAHTVLGFYVQDDFRVASNFTLNLGLRYEFNTDFEEVRGHAAPFLDIRLDPAPTVGRLVYENPTLRNLGPRFGFAWDVRGDGRTAVRGGFGVLYDLSNVTYAVIRGVCTAPFCNFSTVTNPPPLTTVAFSFPPETLGKSLIGLDYHLQQPHMLQYNLTVERQLPAEIALTLSYTGSRGLNLSQVTEGNPTVPQVVDGRKFWTGREPRVNPRWETFEMFTGGANSWYNALQVSVLKRMTRGLQFQSAYTWSKVMDEPQGVAEGGWLPDPSNRKADRAVAGFDVAHNWRFNALYRFPELARTGGVLGTLLNGWRMSGILSLQTGYAVNPALTFNRSRSGVAGGANVFDRPDLTPGVNVADITQGASRGCGTGSGAIVTGTRLGDPWRWFDPCAFALPTPGYLGNAGRNIIRGPGLANLDFSLRKDTPLRFLGEGGQLEFRAEIFNILNRVNFSEPSGGVYAGRAAVENPLATAGRITSTRTNSRQIQLALKIIF